jgi:hypothetical protein
MPRRVHHQQSLRSHRYDSSAPIVESCPLVLIADSRHRNVLPLGTKNGNEFQIAAVENRGRGLLADALGFAASHKLKRIAIKPTDREESIGRWDRPARDGGVRFARAQASGSDT